MFFGISSHYLEMTSELYFKRNLHGFPLETFGLWGVVGWGDGEEVM